MTLLDSPAPWEDARDIRGAIPDSTTHRQIAGLAHLIAELTPEEATTRDLLRIADILEAAGVRPWLLRRANLRPALAIDSELRATALAALAEDAAHEPWVAARPGGGIRSLIDARRAFGRHDVATVFRPRVNAAGTLRHGVEVGVRVEFWRREGAVFHAPRANALTRRVIAGDDLSLTTVRRHGRAWTTIEGMFAPGQNEFTDDIDIVFSWVDGSSRNFQRERAERMHDAVIGDGDDHSARFRQVDELRYALRSVHMYAPWIRRIFIATDSPAPWWLAEHPRVTIVRSEEFFADPSVLPTHNSHAVEAQLHRIPGLAEHFLYSNDDMFFGRPVRQEMFFTSAGVSRFVESRVRIGVGSAAPSRSGHDNAARVNRELLRERFGRTITRDLEHCAAPLRRSVMRELEREFPGDFARTAAARFRSGTDISVTNSLYHYYALLTGRAVVAPDARTRYVQTTERAALGALGRLVARRDVDMFCLNDGSAPEISEDVRERAVRDALEAYFPIAAPWELATD